jgi:hypothetical protein
MAPPTIASAGDLSSHLGHNVILQGTYGVQDLGGHAIKVQGPDGTWTKRTKIAYVQLGQGTFVELADRPDGEMHALEGRQVLAAGTLVRPPGPPSGGIAATSSSPMTLVQVTSVKDAT